MSSKNGQIWPNLAKLGQISPAVDGLGAMRTAMLGTLETCLMCAARAESDDLARAVGPWKMLSRRSRRRRRVHRESSETTPSASPARASEELCAGASALAAPGPTPRMASASCAIRSHRCSNAGGRPANVAWHQVRLLATLRLRVQLRRKPALWSRR